MTIPADNKLTDVSLDDGLEKVAVRAPDEVAPPESAPVPTHESPTKGLNQMELVDKTFSEPELEPDIDLSSKPPPSSADSLKAESAFQNTKEMNKEAAAATTSGTRRDAAKQDRAGDLPQRDFPSVFYCPRTGVLMTDPVVGQDGESVEKSAVGSSETTPFYPNRALQSIIQETITLQGDSHIRASLRNFQQSVSQGLYELMPGTTASEPIFRPLNDAYYCPITFNLMHTPVVDPEGNTFEKVAVENWIRVNGSSPITRTELQLDQLYPNKAIERLLQMEKQRPEDRMHPAIKKWKDEEAPVATDVELGGGAVLDHEQRQNRQQRFSVVVITNRNGNNSFPTTPSEWEERERARRRSIYRAVGIFFAGICLIGFVLYGSIFFLMLFTMTILMLFSNRQRRQ